MAMGTPGSQTLEHPQKLARSGFGRFKWLRFSLLVEFAD